MISIDGDIVPGVGAGGIRIGMICDELFELSVASAQDFREVTESRMRVFQFFDGSLTVLIERPSEVVVSVVCNRGYRGNFRGITTGITFSELLSVTKHHWIVDGYLFFDDVLLLGLDIPDHWQGILLDDVDNPSQLPSELVFESIRVFSNHNSPAVRIRKGKSKCS